MRLMTDRLEQVIVRTSRRNWLPVFCLSALIAIVPSSLAITPEAFTHYKQALVREKMNDLPGAEQELRLTIGLDPTDSLALIHLAHIVAQNKRFDEALMLYQDAFNLNPRDKMLHLNMGHILVAKNDPRQALSHYLQLIENPNTPAYPYAYLLIGQQHAKLNETTAAKEAFERFLAFYPNHPEALMELTKLGVAAPMQQTPAPVQVAPQPPAGAVGTPSNVNPKPSQPAYNPPAPQQPGFQATLPPMYFGPRRPAPNELLPLPIIPNTQGDEPAAQQAIKEGRLDDAVAAYNAAIGQNPSAKYPLYLNIADIATKQNQPQRVEEALNQYVHFEPNNPRVLLGLGDLAIQRQDYRLAANHYAQGLLVSRDPAMQQDIRKHFAYATQMLGDLPQAEMLYKEVLRQEPQALDIKKNLALTYQQQGKLLQAAELYRSFVPQEDPQSSYRHDMGNVLMSLGNQSLMARDTDSAKQYFEEARNVSPQLKTVAERAIAELKTAAPQTFVASTTPSQPAIAKTAAPSYVSSGTPSNNSMPDDNWDLRSTTPSTATATTPPKQVMIGQSSPIVSTPTTASKPPTTTTKAPATTAALAASTKTPVTSSSTAAMTAAATQVSKPITGDSKTLLAEARQLVEKKQFEQAVKRLEAISSPTFESHTLLSRANQGLSNNAQAAQNLENALSLKPNDVDTLASLGQLYRQNGDLDKAETAFQKVKTARPTDHENLYDLGVVQQMQGKIDDSILSFKDSVKQNPTWPDAYYGLGVAYEGKRNFSGAINAYEEYLKLVKAGDPVADSLKKHVGLLQNYLILAKQGAAKTTASEQSTP